MMMITVYTYMKCTICVMYNIINKFITFRVTMESIGWNFLPHSILVDIFFLLSPSDRFYASLTCRSWNACFHMPCVWSKVSFRFIAEQNSNCLQCVDKFGSYLKTVCIELDQYQPVNRTCACKVLSAIARLHERRIRRLKIKFVGENPCLYAGQEFVNALCELFGPVPEKVHIVNSLVHVDLSGMNVAFDGSLLDLLSENNPLLETLNIQNMVLICQVGSSATLRLVERCRRLWELCIYNHSLSEDVLLALTADDRAPLCHLSVYFRREDKFSRDIPTDVWKTVTGKLPRLRVTLGFDHTCPLSKLSEVHRKYLPVNLCYLCISQKVSK